MNKPHLLITKLLLTLALLTIAPMVTALDQETFYFEEIVACPSEDIFIAGTVRFQTQYVEGADHTTWVFQAFWRGDAYGLTSGAEYLLRGKWMEVVQENPPFIFLWNDHFQLIGKGKAENYELHWKMRLVVNANGEVVVDWEDVVWPCP